MSGPIVYMTVVGVIYWIGVAQIRSGNWKAHRALMWLGFSMDMLLTLYLEVAKNVIEKSAGKSAEPFTGNGYLLGIHVSFAVLLLIAYGFSLYLGTKGMKTGHTSYSKQVVRGRHRVLGYIALALYVLSYLTAPGWLIEMAINWANC